jgi:hypothetical protein
LALPKMVVRQACKSPFSVQIAYASISARTGFSWAPSPAFKNDADVLDAYSRAESVSGLLYKITFGFDVKIFSGEAIVVISAPASRKTLSAWMGNGNAVLNSAMAARAARKLGAAPTRISSARANSAPIWARVKSVGETSFKTMSSTVQIRAAQSVFEFLKMTIDTLVFKPSFSTLWRMAEIDISPF